MNTTLVATVVDRATRVVDLVATASREADCVKERLIARVNNHRSHRLPWNTLTWDQGMELAEHGAVTEHMGVDVFFAGSRSPWQRGRMRTATG